MRIKGIAAVLVCVVTAAATGCGGTDDGSPEGVVSAYIEAALAKNAAGMRAVLSPRAIGAYGPNAGTTLESALSERIAMFAEVKGFEVVETDERSGYTLVTVRFTLADGKTRDRKWPVKEADGRWRLDELKGPN